MGRDIHAPPRHARAVGQPCMASHRPRARRGELGTSDQATERNLADVGFAPAPSCQALRRPCDRIIAGESGLADPASKKAYLLPDCLYMLGHLHLLYNGLEESVKKSALWGAHFVVGLKATLQMMVSRGMRDRFVMTCVRQAPAGEREVFSRFGIGGGGRRASC